MLIDYIVKVPDAFQFNGLTDNILEAFGSEMIWYEGDSSSPSSALYFDPTQINHQLIPTMGWFRQYFSAFKVSNELPDLKYVEEVFSALANRLKPPKLKCVLVPAIRSVGKKGSVLEDFSGAGIIDRLAELQSPDHANWSGENEIFQRVNSLVQFVLSRDDARIEVPHHREHINLHIDNKILPLDSLGTGVQQLILIGSFCCMNDDGIICLEEPETHLHPAMQKKLFHFLMKETSAQYFVATHSAAIIDLPGATVFHVQNDGDQTRIRLAAAANEKFQACHNLGYRASDIAQANYVLWVEGPSDRVYLVNWLKQVAEDLEEGLHYTVMFYGGRLLSHLSVDDDEVEDFINLLALGRSAGIVIDSDKKSARAAINKTKQRIVEEFEAIESFNLVTPVKEIENYYPFSRFLAAMKEVHASLQIQQPESERYADYFLKKQDSKEDTRKTEKAKVDKIRVASVLANDPIGSLNYGLEKSVKELADHIRKANAVD